MCSLGVLLDPSVSLEAQVALVAQSAFYQLRLVAQLCPYLDGGRLASATYVLAISRLDYCNTLFVRLPLKLQLACQELKREFLERAGEKLTAEPSGFSEGSRDALAVLHSDQDRGDGSLKYILSGDGAGDLFIINENTGDIQATRRLDREEKPVYTLRAQAVNKRTGVPVEPESEFIIKIHDINDNEPLFTKDIYNASVPEMSDVGTFVVQVTATDADDPTYGNSARVVYSILQGQPYFSVESESGIIKTALLNMDRENKEQYQVVIQAKDMGGQMGGLSGTTTVNITLTDVNDNPPRFPQSAYQFKIPESTPPDSPVGRIKATDADVGSNAEMEYSILEGDGSEMFGVVTDEETQEGIVTVKKALDFEKKRQFTLKVEASNPHVDPRFLYLGPFKDITTVRIQVEDIDEPPVFSKPAYVLEVKENVQINTVIGSVSARDPDSAKNPIK
ncbi:Cadherin-6 [Varanus komodoensis]|nr:Cadherin-6 [Varanus komodoensis]